MTDPAHNMPRPLAGAIIDGAHCLVLRVYYEDTDFSGIVYHASYVRFLERGRTDALRLAGIDQSTLFADGQGLALVVRSLTIDYLKPAKMDDILTVETRLKEMRGASFALNQRILHGEDVLITAEVLIAALAHNRPARIPEAVRVALVRIGG